MVWSKVRFVFFVNLQIWQFALLLLVIAAVIFLLLDHLFNRSR